MSPESYDGATSCTWTLHNGGISVEVPTPSSHFPKLPEHFSSTGSLLEVVEVMSEIYTTLTEFNSLVLALSSWNYSDKLTSLLSSRNDSDVYKPPRSRGKDKDSSALSNKVTSSSKRCTRHWKNILDFPSLAPGSMPNEVSPSPAGLSPVNIPLSSCLPDVNLMHSPTTSKTPFNSFLLASPTLSLSSLARAHSEMPDDLDDRLFTCSVRTLDLFVEDLELSLKRYHSVNFDARLLLKDYGFQEGTLHQHSPDFQAGLLAILDRWETPHVEGFWLILNKLAVLKEDLKGFVFDPNFKSLRSLEGIPDSYLLQATWVYIPGYGAVEDSHGVGLSSEDEEGLEVVPGAIAEDQVATVEGLEDLGEVQVTTEALEALLPLGGRLTLPSRETPSQILMATKLENPSLVPSRMEWQPDYHDTIQAEVEPLVCSRVLAQCPRSWGTYILSEHSQTIRELLERVNSEQPRLLYAWEHERKEAIENDKATRPANSCQQSAFLITTPLDDDINSITPHLHEFLDSETEPAEALAVDRRQKQPK
ncbi:hypothetical protein BDN71DRAFT_1433097 [Pleurotus eryngii]|uniref:Uncharacterized protein n=1 Tax=Pleurotus eryngii TaxID=5323 RepID=A0A9P6DEK5_PLEER|nr:hypothetical protein BDN71DRAFT_1433097 [Pleurotus eryngii]